MPKKSNRVILRWFIVLVIASLLFFPSFSVISGESSSPYDDRSTEKETDNSGSLEGAESIYDWYDLYDVRDDLGGDYVLENDLNEQTDGYDELAAEDANEVTDRGEWESGIEYDQNDLVTNDGEQYYAMVDHLSDDDNEPGSWGSDYEEYWVAGVDGAVEGDTLGWRPIAHSAESGDDGFFGSLDGQGYSIDDFYIDREHEDQVGIISVSTGEVRNIEMETFEVSGDDDVGAIVGENYHDSLVENVHVSDGIIKGQTAGGIAGRSWRGDILHSSAEVTLEGQYMGGIAGQGTNSLTSNCYAQVETARDFEDWRVGGLIGWQFIGTIKNSHAEVDISGGDQLGGIAGQASNKVIINNTYAEGEVSSGGSDIGGIVGRSDREIEVKNSFFNGTVSGIDNVGTIMGDFAWRGDDPSWIIDTMSTPCDDYPIIGANEYDKGETVGRVTQAPLEDMRNINLYTEGVGDEGWRDYEPLDRAWNITAIDEQEERSLPYIVDDDESVWYIDQTLFDLEVVVEGDGEVEVSWNGDSSIVEDTETFEFPHYQDVDLEISSTADGWHFYNWTGYVEPFDEYEENIGFEMPADDITITANIYESFLEVDTQYWEGEGEIGESVDFEVTITYLCAIEFDIFVRATEAFEEDDGATIDLDNVEIDSEYIESTPLESVGNDVDVLDGSSDPISEPEELDLTWTINIPLGIPHGTHYHTVFEYELIPDDEGMDSNTNNQSDVSDTGQDVQTFQMNPSQDTAPPETNLDRIDAGETIDVSPFIPVLFIVIFMTLRASLAKIDF